MSEDDFNALVDQQLTLYAHDPIKLSYFLQVKATTFNTAAVRALTAVIQEANSLKV
jgi:hypothetical protein